MVEWALRPCNWRENLDRNISIFSGRMGLRACDMRVNSDTNCRLGYLVVGLALRPCNRREKLDRDSRL